MGWSAMMTVQLAVPPRISGPYDGSQTTSLPSSIPTSARSLPASITPWPPNPANTASTCIGSPFRRGARGLRLGAFGLLFVPLEVLYRVVGHHVLLNPLRGLK